MSDKIKLKKKELAAELEKYKELLRTECGKNARLTVDLIAAQQELDWRKRYIASNKQEMAFFLWRFSVGVQSMGTALEKIKLYTTPDPLVLRRFINSLSAGFNVPGFFQTKEEEETDVDAG